VDPADFVIKYLVPPSSEELILLGHLNISPLIKQLPEYTIVSHQVGVPTMTNT